MPPPLRAHRRSPGVVQRRCLHRAARRGSESPHRRNGRRPRPHRGDVQRRQGPSRQTHRVVSRVPQFGHQHRPSGAHRQPAGAHLFEPCSTDALGSIPDVVWTDPAGGPTGRPHRPREPRILVGHPKSSIRIPSPLARHRHVWGRNDHRRRQRVAVAGVRCFTRRNTRSWRNKAKSAIPDLGKSQSFFPCSGSPPLPLLSTGCKNPAPVLLLAPGLDFCCFRNAYRWSGTSLYRRSTPMHTPPSNAVATSDPVRYNAVSATGATKPPV